MITVVIGDNYNYEQMKRLIITGIFAASSLLMPHVLRASVWFMETDTEVSVPMEQVNYLLATDGNDSFSIVKKDGSLVNEVRHVTFSRHQTTQTDTPVNRGIQLYPNPVNHVLHLDGIPAGQSICILSADGLTVRKEKAHGGKVSLYVDDLPQGIYFLQTANNTIKFVKR